MAACSPFSIQATTVERVSRIGICSFCRSIACMKGRNPRGGICSSTLLWRGLPKVGGLFIVLHPPHHPSYAVDSLTVPCRLRRIILPLSCCRFSYRPLSCSILLPSLISSDSLTVPCRLRPIIDTFAKVIDCRRGKHTGATPGAALRAPRFPIRRRAFRRSAPPDVQYAVPASKTGCRGFHSEEPGAAWLARRGGRGPAYQLQHGNDAERHGDRTPA